jgi:hypothetical protein
MRAPSLSPRLYWLALCAVSAVVALLSVAQSFFPNLSPRVVGLLYRVTLASENTVGAWWSGMLLLLGALHFADGYFCNRAQAPRLAWAWLILASVLLALSADEVGSFHERVAEWSLVAPFAAVLLGAAAWSFWQLWRHPLHRRDSVLIALGFVLFASVALQEFIQHAVVWPEALQPLRMLVEESTELVAMLLLISVGLRNSTGLFAAPGSVAAAKAPALQGSTAMPGWLLLVAVVMIPLLSLFSASYHDDVRGHPADWLAASLLLCAAAATLRDFLRGRALTLNRAALAGVLLFASLVTVCIEVDGVATIASVMVNKRVAVLAVLAFAAAALLAIEARRSRVAGGISLLLVVLAVVNVLIALQAPGLYATFVATTVAALALFCASSPDVVRNVWQLFAGFPATPQAASRQ